MRLLQAGGTLGPDALYVNRLADERLFEKLQAGFFCHVLAPRQVGKSSLGDRVAKRLNQSGTSCVFVDLTNIGAGATAEQWFLSLATEIAAELNLENPRHYWQSKKDIGVIHRWSNYLYEKVLPSVSTKLIIMLDEIDVTLNLEFRGDLFGQIRSIYNARARNTLAEKLSFCLFGTATPLDLTDEEKRTPFNISHAIVLDDFSREQVDAFKSALDQILPGDSSAWLSAIWEQTHGHPLMTQRICLELIDVLPRLPRTIDSEDIARVVLSASRPEIFDCISEVDRRLPAGHTSTRQQLALYRRILKGEEIESIPNDPTQLRLRMTGLVADRVGNNNLSYLRVRNQIFKRKYHIDWVDARDERPPYVDDMASWAKTHSKDYLQSGTALENMKQWAQLRGYLSPEEQEYLSESVEHSRREAEAAKRTARNFKFSVSAAILGPVIVLAIVFAGTDRIQTKQALSKCNELTSSCEASKKITEDNLKLCNAEPPINKITCKQDLNMSQLRNAELREELHTARKANYNNLASAKEVTKSDLKLCTERQKLLSQAYVELYHKTFHDTRSSNPIITKEINFEIKQILRSALSVCYDFTDEKQRKDFFTKLKITLDLYADGHVVFKLDIAPKENRVGCASQQLQLPQFMTQLQTLAKKYSIHKDQPLLINIPDSFGGAAAKKKKSVTRRTDRRG